MERIEQPKTAVPLEVQRVLDAMTEENWAQDVSKCDARMCFMSRADAVYGLRITMFESLSGSFTWMGDLERRCKSTYGCSLILINDIAKSLSDFKSKIIALYEVP